MTVYRFAEFTLDERRHELAFRGRAVRLAPQPFRLLVALAARPGELVRREELERALWGEGTYVDADAGLNFCVKTLRRALSSAAGSDEEWIETVPRLGYRLRAEVSCVGSQTGSQTGSETGSQTGSDTEAAPPAPARVDPPPVATAPPPRSRLRRFGASSLLALFAASAVAFVAAGRVRDGAVPSALAVDVRAESAGEAETAARAFEAELVAALIDAGRGKGEVAIAHGDVAAGKARRLEARWLETPAGLRVDLRLVRASGVVDWQRSVEMSRKRWFYGRSTYAAGIALEVGTVVWPPVESPADPPALTLAIAQIEGREPGGGAAALAPLEELAAAEPARQRVFAYLAEARLERWDLDGSEQAARHALELDPTCAAAERAFALVLTARGRFDGAVAAAWRGRVLAPLERRSHTMLARALLFAGRYQQVVTETDVGLAIFPDLKQLWRWRYLAFLELGETARAGEALSSLIHLLPTGGWPAPPLAEATMEEIRSVWRADLAGTLGIPASSSYERAVLHALLGEREAALAELERSIAARHESAVFAGVAPWFAALRSDPRFQELVRRVEREGRG